MSHLPKRLDDHIKRAALYARVSTEEQAMHGVSLDAQKERLCQYAESNGLYIVDLYVDEGISARKRYTRRPAFMRMLEDVRAQKIDVVLFVKLDRWFRNIADYYEVQAILDENHVQWIATEEDYDTTTANGRLALNIKLAIAQDESDRTSERIKFVFQNMVKEGRVITGKLPLGYKIENKRAVIDEEVAPLVRDVFQTYVDTRSIKATSRYILTTYGKVIDVKSLRKMLQNPMYIGNAYGVDHFCPPIIDENTFQLAGKLIEIRSGRYDGTRSDRVYLFTGLVFCGSCGRRMSTYTCTGKAKEGSIPKRFIYYRCPAHTMKLCDMHRQFNQSKLEDWLVQNLRAEADRYNATLKKVTASIPKKVSDTAKIMAKIDKLKDLYLHDLLPKELYERDYAVLSAALEEAKRQQEIVARKPIDTTVFKDFRVTYEQLDEKAKKAFWSRTIQKITVSPSGDIRVVFHEG